MHSTAHFAQELGAFPGKCYLSAMVLNTDYNDDDEYVVSTTVNGVEVHGRCYPKNDAHPGGAEADGLFFPCFTLVPLPAAADDKYVVVMTATPAVDEAFGNPLALATANPNYANDAVFVEYIVSCERDHCSTPQSPPSPPPSPLMSPPTPSSPSAPLMCAYGLVGQGSGETSTVAVRTQAAEAKAVDAAQCYLTVEVKNTDYDQVDEYIINTTANGVEVHGKCSPLDGAMVDEDGYFLCARRVALPLAADGVYDIETTASAEVEEAFDGNYVVIDYTVHCVSDECRHRELATCLYTAEDRDALASPLTIVTAPHTMNGACYLKVELSTDYLSNSDEHVITTTVNGQTVGTCSQWAHSTQSLGGAAAVSNGTFKCVDFVPLPASEDGAFTLLTNVTATEGVADAERRLSETSPVFYTQSNSNTACDSIGELITTIAECSAAAVALNLGPLTATTTPGLTSPFGCGRKAGGHSAATQGASSSPPSAWGRLAK